MVIDMDTPCVLEFIALPQNAVCDGNKVFWAENQYIQVVEILAKNEAEAVNEAELSVSVAADI